MRTWITSDIHLGSRQCRVADFMALLDALPAGDRLVLNGDVVTHFTKEAGMPATHVAVLERLRALACEREVIWTRGNNDRRFVMRDPGKISFVNDYVVNGKLYVAHGDRFDHLTPALRLLMIPLRVVYEFSTRMVGSRTHVASFAKKFPLVYNLLNRHVALNAIAYAHRYGYQAVTCGHTHHPESREVEGVRYLNTGCWTEHAARCVLAEDDRLTLVEGSVNGLAAAVRNGGEVPF